MCSRVPNTAGTCTTTLLSRVSINLQILSWKTSSLVRSKIRRLFSHTLPADRKYSHHRWDKLPQQVQTLLSQKQKTFFEFLLHFWNLDKILLISKKKIGFIAWIFWKLFTTTNGVPSMPLSSCFRTPFTSKRVDASQTLLGHVIQHFHPKFALI